MGQTGIRVMTRIMGLLLAAIAVQFVITGGHNALRGAAVSPGAVADSVTKGELRR